MINIGRCSHWPTTTSSPAALIGLNQAVYELPSTGKLLSETI